MSDAPHQVVEVIVPEVLSSGVYANAFGCWFSQTEFTLDCLVSLPPEAAQDGEGKPYVRLPVQVVARVKFPTAVIFRLMQALEVAMTRYETQFGTIQHVGEPIPPPPDNSPPAPA